MISCPCSIMEATSALLKLFMKSVPATNSVNGRTTRYIFCRVGAEAYLNSNNSSSSERPRAVPAVPGFVNEDGAVGELTPTAGAVSEFGCAGHEDQCGAGCDGDSHGSTGCRSDAGTRSRHSY